jgi:WD40 repeat protein/serine/threonine protein kinase
MSIPSPSSRVFDSVVAAWLEPLVRRFEEAWQRGERPDIDTFLPIEADRRRIARIELIHLELELRLHKGEAARVEEYLNRYPELTENRSLVLELVHTELRFRARNEPALQIDEYRRRFPLVATELAEGHITLAAPGEQPSLPPTIDFGHTDEPTLNVVAEKPQVPGYMILEELGRGGMGVVYKAKHLALRRMVALKMILNGSFADGEDRRRFLAEAHALARLQHPNVVQVYEVGEHRGQPFFALELIEGGTLAKRMTDKPLSVTEAAQLMATLARAMNAAHTAHIVHRDLKPANIMLTAEGTPKIGDFGLAKHLDAETMKTRSGAIMGTPAYMAPEQASGRTKMVGPSADIYALGVILYEMLTGQVPFRGVTQIDVLQKVLNDEPISLRRLAPRLPRDMETICFKCLEKKAERRYRSALELAEDLERYLAGVPIRARRSSMWERGVKWARRRPAMAGLLAVLLLSLSAMVGIWVYKTFQLQKMLDERTSELRSEQDARDSEARQRQAELRRELRLDRYVADIRQAEQFRQLGEISQCYNFMTSRRWIEGEDDPRGFEWRYLRNWCDSEPRHLEGHKAAVRCVRFHPDGRMLASGSADQTIRFWDADTGAPLGTLADHSKASGITFSPDGRTLASANDGHIQMWDVAERRPQAVVLERVSYVDTIEFSPRGDLLAFTDNHDIWLYDVKARSVRHRWHADGVLCRSLAFAPDGQSLAIGYENGMIALRDVVSGKERARLLTKHAIHALAFAKRSPLLAVSGSDGVVNFWDFQTRALVGEVAGHTGMVHSLAYSPDERTLLSAGEDGTLRSWDTATLRPQAIYRMHNHPILSVSFRADGRTFAAGASDGSVSLWSATTAEKTDNLHLAVDPAGPIAFSPNGKWLAAAGLDRTVRLLDSATRRVMRTLHGWYGEWQDLAFSPDGKHLAAACSDHRVHVWDTESERRIHQLLAHRDTVTCLTYSADGKFLAAGGADHRIAVWEMPEGKLRTIFDAHEDPITGMTFHPNSDMLASTSRDQCLKLWSVPAFQPLRRIAREEELLGVTCIDAGRTLLVNGEVSGVSAWSFKGDQELIEGKGFPGSARHLAVSHKAHQLASSAPGGIDVYDLLTRSVQMHLWFVTGNRSSRSMAFSPDGTRLIVNQRGGPLQWWNTNSHRMDQTVDERPYPVQSLAFTPRGETLIAGTKTSDFGKIRTPISLGCVSLGVNDRTPCHTIGDLVRFWCMKSGQPRQVLSEMPTLANQPLVAVSPDGRTLATGADDGSVSLWDLESGKRRARLLVSRRSRTYLPLVVELSLVLGTPLLPEFDGGRMRAVAFSPDGRLLAMASEDGQVQLWETSSGKEWASLPGEHADVSCLAFSPDGKRLATNNGNTIELWDLSAEEGKPVLSRKIQGHSATVRCLVFSSDGRLLASGEDNWDIRLWNTANGAEARRLQGHIGRVSSLAFHPDGKTLASASWDGTVRLWHLATGHELMVLQRGARLIHALAFSPDGTILAASGEWTNGRGEVWFWRDALVPK